MAWPQRFTCINHTLFVRVLSKNLHQSKFRCCKINFSPALKKLNVFLKRPTSEAVFNESKLGKLKREHDKHWKKHNVEQNPKNLVQNSYINLLSIFSNFGPFCFILHQFSLKPASFKTIFTSNISNVFLTLKSKMTLRQTSSFHGHL